jgi:hypothetical protein
VISIVSHDAGGAEILSSLVRHNNLNCNFILDGPAVNIFKGKLGDISLSMLDAISNSDSVLCGSSWSSDLELQAISYAKSSNKITTVFLDHWINYKERFTRKGETLLPGNILVGDVYAETIAKAAFPDLDVSLVGNPYLKDVYNDYEILKGKYKHKGGEISVLYVCEPIREHALKQYGDELHWGYTEEDALNYFLANINLFGERIENITIRLHPAEKRGKYDWVMDKFSLPISIDQNSTLIESVVKADIVAGCESMAMVVGLIAEKKVISSIPPMAGRKCVLPHTDIIHLQSLLVK